MVSLPSVVAPDTVDGLGLGRSSLDPQPLSTSTMAIAVAVAAAVFRSPTLFIFILWLHVGPTGSGESGGNDLLPMPGIEVVGGDLGSVGRTGLGPHRLEPPAGIFDHLFSDHHPTDRQADHQHGNTDHDHDEIGLVPEVGGRLPT